MLIPKVTTMAQVDLYLFQIDALWGLILGLVLLVVGLRLRKGKKVVG